MKTEREIRELLQSNPQVQSSLFDDRIQIIHLYKQQLLSFFKTEKLPKPQRVNQFVEAVFSPYEEYWTAFFTRERFAEWMEKNLEELKVISDPGIQLPFEVDFSSLFEVIAGRLKKLTGKPMPPSKWYLVYRHESDMGSLWAGEIMFVHFLNLGRRPGHLEFMLPHEINHQIFREFNEDKHSLLTRIIDEGLACYVNYLYWDKKFSPAENIDFTEDEWAWSIENERKIFEYAKGYLNSQDRNVIEKFSAWHQYIWDGTPDRLTYFIGFRICEAFVSQNGANSWRMIYDLPVLRVLELSDYEDFIPM